MLHPNRKKIKYVQDVFIFGIFFENGVLEDF